TKENFVRQVSTALRNDDESQRRRRIEVAESNSWDKRISQISEKIELHMEEVGRSKPRSYQAQD
ncbi:MAG: hypothetical protein ACFFCW_48110, partial [Candidatus Hodarchaeota archaeon]